MSESVKCEALSQFPGKAGGSLEPCKFRAKYKVVSEYNPPLYLCCIHFKRLALSPSDIVIELQKAALAKVQSKQSVEPVRKDESK